MGNVTQNKFPNKTIEEQKVKSGYCFDNEANLALVFSINILPL